MKRRGGVADWSGGVLPGDLGMGKVHASTYFSHGPSRSSGPPGSPGPPEPSGLPDPDSLQLELVCPSGIPLEPMAVLKLPILKYY